MRFDRHESSAPTEDKGPGRSVSKMHSCFSASLNRQECAHTRWRLNLARYRSAYSSAHQETGIVGPVWTKYN